MKILSGTPVDIKLLINSTGEYSSYNEEIVFASMDSGNEMEDLANKLNEMTKKATDALTSEEFRQESTMLWKEYALSTNNDKNVQYSKLYNSLKKKTIDALFSTEEVEILFKLKQYNNSIFTSDNYEEFLHGYFTVVDSVIV